LERTLCSSDIMFFGRSVKKRFFAVGSAEQLNALYGVC